MKRMNGMQEDLDMSFMKIEQQRKEIKQLVEEVTELKENVNEMKTASLGFDDDLFDDLDEFDKKVSCGFVFSGWIVKLERS
jgi:hypothetical protein